MEESLQFSRLIGSAVSVQQTVPPLPLLQDALTNVLAGCSQLQLLTLQRVYAAYHYQLVGPSDEDLLLSTTGASSHQQGAINNHGGAAHGGGGKSTSSSSVITHQQQQQQAAWAVACTPSGTAVTAMGDVRGFLNNNNNNNAFSTESSNAVVGSGTGTVGGATGSSATGLSTRLSFTSFVMEPCLLRRLRRSMEDATHPSSSPLRRGHAAGGEDVFSPEPQLPQHQKLHLYSPTAAGGSPLQEDWLDGTLDGAAAIAALSSTSAGRVGGLSLTAAPSSMPYVSGGGGAGGSPAVGAPRLDQLLHERVMKETRRRDDFAVTTSGVLALFAGECSGSIAGSNASSVASSSAPSFTPQLGLPLQQFVNAIYNIFFCRHGHVVEAEILRAATKLRDARLQKAGRGLRGVGGATTSIGNGSYSPVGVADESPFVDANNAHALHNYIQDILGQAPAPLMPPELVVRFVAVAMRNFGYDGNSTLPASSENIKAEEEVNALSTQQQPPHRKGKQGKSNNNNAGPPLTAAAPEGALRVLLNRWAFSLAVPMDDHHKHRVDRFRATRQKSFTASSSAARRGNHAAEGTTGRPAAVISAGKDLPRAKGAHHLNKSTAPVPLPQKSDDYYAHNNPFSSLGNLPTPLEVMQRALKGVSSMVPSAVPTSGASTLTGGHNNALRQSSTHSNSVAPGNADHHHHFAGMRSHSVSAGASTAPAGGGGGGGAGGGPAQPLPVVLVPMSEEQETGLCEHILRSLLFQLTKASPKPLLSFLHPQLGLTSDDENNGSDTAHSGGEGGDGGAGGGKARSRHTSVMRAPAPHPPSSSRKSTVATMPPSRRPGAHHQHHKVDDGMPLITSEMSVIPDSASTVFMAHDPSEVGLLVDDNVHSSSTGHPPDSGPAKNDPSRLDAIRQKIRRITRDPVYLEDTVSQARSVLDQRHNGARTNAASSPTHPPSTTSQRKGNAGGGKAVRVASVSVAGGAATVDDDRKSQHNGGGNSIWRKARVLSRALSYVSAATVAEMERVSYGGGLGAGGVLRSFGGDVKKPVGFASAAIGAVKTVKRRRLLAKLARDERQARRAAALKDPLLQMAVYDSSEESLPETSSSSSSSSSASENSEEDEKPGDGVTATESTIFELTASPSTSLPEKKNKKSRKSPKSQNQSTAQQRGSSNAKTSTQSKKTAQLTAASARDFTNISASIDTFQGDEWRVLCETYVVPWSNFTAFLMRLEEKSEKTAEQKQLYRRMRVRYTPVSTTERAAARLRSRDFTRQKGPADEDGSVKSPRQGPATTAGTETSEPRSAPSLSLVDGESVSYDDLHRQCPSVMTMSPGATALVTAGTDGLVKLWCPETGAFGGNVFNGSFSWVAGVQFLYSSISGPFSALSGTDEAVLAPHSLSTLLHHNQQHASGTGPGVAAGGGDAHPQRSGTIIPPLVVITTNGQITVIDLNSTKRSVLQKYVGAQSAEVAAATVPIYSTLHTQRYGLLPGETGARRSEALPNMEHMSRETYRQLRREAGTRFLMSSNVSRIQEPVSGPRRQLSSSITATTGDSSGGSGTAGGAPPRDITGNRFGSGATGTIDGRPLLGFSKPTTFACFPAAHGLCAFGSAEGSIGVFDLLGDLGRASAYRAAAAAGIRAYEHGSSKLARNNRRGGLVGFEGALPAEDEDEGWSPTGAGGGGGSFFPGTTQTGGGSSRPSGAMQMLYHEPHAHRDVVTGLAYAARYETVISVSLDGQIGTLKLNNGMYQLLTNPEMNREYQGGAQAVGAGMRGPRPPAGPPLRHTDMREQLAAAAFRGSYSMTPVGGAPEGGLMMGTPSRLGNSTPSMEGFPMLGAGGGSGNGGGGTDGQRHARRGATTNRYVAKAIHGVQWCEKLQIFATFGSDRIIRLWSLLKKDPIHVITPAIPCREILSVDFAPALDQLLVLAIGGPRDDPIASSRRRTGLEERNVFVLDVRTSRLVQVIPLAASGVSNEGIVADARDFRDLFETARRNASSSAGVGESSATEELAAMTLGGGGDASTSDEPSAQAITTTTGKGGGCPSSSAAGAATHRDPIATQQQQQQDGTDNGDDIGRAVLYDTSRCTSGGTFMFNSDRGILVCALSAPVLYGCGTGPSASQKLALTKSTRMQQESKQKVANKAHSGMSSQQPAVVGSSAPQQHQQNAATTTTATTAATAAAATLSSATKDDTSMQTQQPPQVDLVHATQTAPTCEVIIPVAHGGSSTDDSEPPEAHVLSCVLTAEASTNGTADHIGTRRRPSRTLSSSGLSMSALTGPTSTSATPDLTADRNSTMIFASSASTASPPAAAGCGPFDTDSSSGHLPAPTASVTWKRTVELLHSRLGADYLPVLGLFYNANNKMLYSMDKRGICAWDVRTGEHLHTAALAQEVPRLHHTFDAVGRLVASATVDVPALLLLNNSPVMGAGTGTPPTFSGGGRTSPHQHHPQESPRGYHSGRGLIPTPAASTSASTADPQQQQQPFTSSRVAVGTIPTYATVRMSRAAYGNRSGGGGSGGGSAGDSAGGALSTLSLEEGSDGSGASAAMTHTGAAAWGANRRRTIYYTATREGELIGWCPLTGIAKVIVPLPIEIINEAALNRGAISTGDHFGSPRPRCPPLPTSLKEVVALAQRGSVLVAAVGTRLFLLHLHSATGMPVILGGGGSGIGGSTSGVVPDGLVRAPSSALSVIRLPSAKSAGVTSVRVVREDFIVCGCEDGSLITAELVQQRPGSSSGGGGGGLGPSVTSANTAANDTAAAAGSSSSRVFREYARCSQTVPFALAAAYCESLMAPTAPATTLVHTLDKDPSDRAAHLRRSHSVLSNTVTSSSGVLLGGGDGGADGEDTFDFTTNAGATGHHEQAPSRAGASSTPSAATLARTVFAAATIRRLSATAASLGTTATATTLRNLRGGARGRSAMGGNDPLLQHCYTSSNSPPWFAALQRAVSKPAPVFAIEYLNTHRQGVLLVIYESGVVVVLSVSDRAYIFGFAAFEMADAKDDSADESAQQRSGGGSFATVPSAITAAAVSAEEDVLWIGDAQGRLVSFPIPARNCKAAASWEIAVGPTLRALGTTRRTALGSDERTSSEADACRFQVAVPGKAVTSIAAIAREVVKIAPPRPQNAPANGKNSGSSTTSAKVGSTALFGSNNTSSADKGSSTSMDVLALGALAVTTTSMEAAVARNTTVGSAQAASSSLGGGVSPAMTPLISPNSHSGAGAVPAPTAAAAGSMLHHHHHHHPSLSIPSPHHASTTSAGPASVWPPPPLTMATLAATAGPSGSEATPPAFFQDTVAVGAADGTLHLVVAFLPVHNMHFSLVQQQQVQQQQQQQSMLMTSVAGGGESTTTALSATSMSRGGPLAATSPRRKQQQQPATPLQLRSLSPAAGPSPWGLVDNIGTNPNLGGSASIMGGSGGVSSHTPPPFGSLVGGRPLTTQAAPVVVCPKLPISGMEMPLFVRVGAFSRWKFDHTSARSAKAESTRSLLSTTAVPTGSVIPLFVGTTWRLQDRSSWYSAVPFVLKAPHPSDELPQAAQPGSDSGGPQVRGTMEQAAIKAEKSSFAASHRDKDQEAFLESILGQHAAATTTTAMTGTFEGGPSAQPVNTESVSTPTPTTAAPAPGAKKATVTTRRPPLAQGDIPQLGTPSAPLLLPNNVKPSIAAATTKTGENDDGRNHGLEVDVTGNKATSEGRWSPSVAAEPQLVIAEPSTANNGAAISRLPRQTDDADGVQPPLILKKSSFLHAEANAKRHAKNCQRMLNANKASGLLAGAAQSLRETDTCFSTETVPLKTINKASAMPLPAQTSSPRRNPAGGAGFLFKHAVGARAEVGSRLEESTRRHHDNAPNLEHTDAIRMSSGALNRSLQERKEKKKEVTDAAFHQASVRFDDHSGPVPPPTGILPPSAMAALQPSAKNSKALSISTSSGAMALQPPSLPTPPSPSAIGRDLVVPQPDGGNATTGALILAMTTPRQRRASVSFVDHANTFEQSSRRTSDEKIANTAEVITNQEADIKKASTSQSGSRETSSDATISAAMPLRRIRSTTQSAEAEPPTFLTDVVAIKNEPQQEEGEKDGEEATSDMGTTSNELTETTRKVQKREDEERLYNPAFTQQALQKLAHTLLTYDAGLQTLEQRHMHRGSPRTSPRDQTVTRSGTEESGASESARRAAVFGDNDKRPEWARKQAQNFALDAPTTPRTGGQGLKAHEHIDSAADVENARRLQYAEGAAALTTSVLASLSLDHGVQEPVPAGINGVTAVAAGWTGVQTARQRAVTALIEEQLDASAQRLLSAASPRFRAAAVVSAMHDNTASPSGGSGRREHETHLAMPPEEEEEDPLKVANVDREVTGILRRHRVRAIFTTSNPQLQTTKATASLVSSPRAMPTTTAGLPLSSSGTLVGGAEGSSSHSSPSTSTKGQLGATPVVVAKTGANAAELLALLPRPPRSVAVVRLRQEAESARTAAVHSAQHHHQSALGASHRSVGSRSARLALDSSQREFGASATSGPLRSQSSASFTRQ